MPPNPIDFNQFLIPLAEVRKKLQIKGIRAIGKEKKKVAKNQLKKLFIFPSPSGKNSHAHDPPSLEAKSPQAPQVQAVLTPLGPYLGVA